MLESLFVSSIGVIGLITLFKVLMLYKPNSIHNKYLIVILSLIVLRFLVIGLFGLFFPDHSVDVLHNFNNVLIIVVPLIFLYLKNLFFNSKEFQYDDFFHLILPLFFVLLDISDKSQIETNSFETPSFLAFFLVYVLAYIALDYQLLKVNLWSKNSLIDTSKNHNKLLKKWSLSLFVFLFLVALRIVFSLYGNIKDITFTFSITNVLVSAIIWLFLFAILLLNTSILKGFKILKEH